MKQIINVITKVITACIVNSCESMSSIVILFKIDRFVIKFYDKHYLLVY